MPTPFNSAQPSEGETPKASRSVFGNFAPIMESDPTPIPLSSSDGERAGERGTQIANPDTNTPTLQASIDRAVARAFIHRYLAKAFEDPEPEGWNWLCDSRVQEMFRSAIATLAPKAPAGSRFESSSAAFLRVLARESIEDFQDGFLGAFGHTVRGDCPLNEIEYGDLKADPLFQPHRLADLGAFYSAFGLEVSEDAAERMDHICLQLEFMAVLAAKEAYALEQQLDGEQLALCRDAQKKFLREHLGRWTPAFTRRLARIAGENPLGALAVFTREFLALDCSIFGVTPGSEDLLLRPVDAAAESACASCGITSLPPGALVGAGEV